MFYVWILFTAKVITFVLPHWESLWLSFVWFLSTFRFEESWTCSENNAVINWFQFKVQYCHIFSSSKYLGLMNKCRKLVLPAPELQPCLKYSTFNKKVQKATEIWLLAPSLLRSVTNPRCASNIVIAPYIVIWWTWMYKIWGHRLCVDSWKPTWEKRDKGCSVKSTSLIVEEKRLPHWPPLCDG